MAMDLAVIELADRIRDRLGAGPDIAEKKMFGAMAFMRHGNMVVAPMKGGALLVRVGKEGTEDALTRPGAMPMDMGGKTMGGFVVVTGDVLEDDEVLDQWIALAETFVATLPPKQA